MAVGGYVAVAGYPVGVLGDLACYIVINKQGEDGEHQEDEYGQHAVLAGQEGHGALLNGAADELDGLGALVLAKDVKGQHGGEGKCRKARGDGYVEDGHGLSP